ncbi:hypothetical protein QOT17_009322 [Balamuthia mandrillaris]
MYVTLSSSLMDGCNTALWRVLPGELGHRCACPPDEWEEGATASSASASLGRLASSRYLCVTGKGGPLFSISAKIRRVSAAPSSAIPLQTPLVPRATCKAGEPMATLPDVRSQLLHKPANSKVTLPCLFFVSTAILEERKNKK